MPGPSRTSASSAPPAIDTSSKSVVQSKASGNVEESESAEPSLHVDAYPDGGIACNNVALMKAQRSAVVELVKQLSKNLLTGQLDLLKISLPVRIFEPRSYLEKLSDAWVYPRYLDAAAECKDPVRRLKLVSTYFVAGFHRALQVWRKPFNPILGETFQATMADGSHIFMEQISHHPPVSAYQIYGAQGRYCFSGTSEPSVSYRGSAMTTRSKGTRVMRFQDGGAIEVQYPTYDLKGLIGTGVAHGEVSGQARLVDAAHGLVVTIRFGALDGPSAGDSALLKRSDALCGVMERFVPSLENEIKEEGSNETMMTSIVVAKPPNNNNKRSNTIPKPGRKGFFRRPAFEAPAPLPVERIPKLKADTSTSSYLTGKAMRGLALIRTSVSISAVTGSLNEEPSTAPATPAVVIAACKGNWLSFLDWDDERFWALERDLPGDWQPDHDTLSSDCRRREDLLELIAGDVDIAQAAKDGLEHKQRHDAKLRKTGRHLVSSEEAQVYVDRG